MNIIENWDEIEEEFRLWDRTINITALVSMALLVVGLISSLLALSLTDLGAFSMCFLLGFGLAGLLYSVVIGDRKIKAHKDRIDKLKM